MRKSADRQRKRQSRAAAPKHPADPPRDLGSEPPRWSSSSRALALPRSTACSGSTLDRSSSNCNDSATSADLHTDLVLRRGILRERQIPSFRIADDSEVDGDKRVSRYPPAGYLLKCVGCC